jgi:hypothetical protein
MRSKKHVYTVYYTVFRSRLGVGISHLGAWCWAIRRSILIDISGVCKANIFDYLLNNLIIYFITLNIINKIKNYFIFIYLFLIIIDHKLNHSEIGSA